MDCLRNRQLFILILIAVFLRLPLLNGSFWLDEAAQALESARPFWQQHLIPLDFQPPLLHYFVHFMIQAGRHEWWLRLVSVTSGLLTLGFLYQLAKTRFSPKVAGIATLLLATSPFHIFFSQELRPYALAGLFGVSSWFFLLNAQKEKSWVPWGGYVLSTVLGLYSMYVYPFNIVSQLVYVFFEEKKSRKKFTISLVLALVLCIPWLPFFLEQLHVGTTLKAQLPGWQYVVSTPQLKAIPMIIGKFFAGQIQFDGSPLRLFAFGFPAAVGLIAVISRYKEKTERFIVYWFFIPLFSSWLVSFVVPVIAPKRLLFILPALLLAIALFVIKQKKHLQLAFLMLFIVVHLGSFGWYLADTRFHREDWRTVIAKIDQENEGSSRIVFAFDDSFAPWRWYPHEPIAVSTSKDFPLTSVEKINPPLSSISEEKIFVFDYLMDLTDPERTIIQWLESHDWKQVGIIDGLEVGFVRMYRRF